MSHFEFSEVYPNSNVDFTEYYEYTYLEIDPQHVSTTLKELSTKFPLLPEVLIFCLFNS